jgi:hypothetical protein
VEQCERNANETFRKSSENRAKIQESFSETVLVPLPNLLSQNELVKVKLKTLGTEKLAKYYVK